MVSWSINNNIFFYPIILYTFNNYIYILNAVLISLHILSIKTNFFNVDIRRNPITCLISFCFGMFYIRNKKIFTSRIILKTSIIISICLYFFKLNKTTILISQIQSFSFLIILIHIGEFIMKTKGKYFFQEISKLSYCIFLLQHITIMDIQRIYKTTILVHIIIVLIITIVFSIVYDKILYIIVDNIINSKVFTSFELNYINN